MSRVAPALLALVALVACAGRGDAGSSEEARLAAIYSSAVILAVEDDHPAGEEPPVVFVVPRPDAKPIPLAVQAAVVDRLAGQVSVRFVDKDDEATDNEADGRPVKEGFLLRLGPVAATGDPIEIVVDRYLSMTAQERLELSVHSEGDGWSARVTGAAPLASGA